MKTCSRRNLMKLAGAGSLLLLLPSLSRMPSGYVHAAEKLDPESPQAKALGYAHHYEDVDTGQWDRYEPGQTCATCQLHLPNDDGEWLGCAIFPGKQVNRDGWCNAWVPKQG